MKSNMWKSTVREIKQSFGRFMAIFAITALGVSLFSGLKVIQPAMLKMTDDYLREKSFYNYRVLSTLGFEEEDLEFLKNQEDVSLIEGTITFDMLCGVGEESPRVIKIHSLPETINDLKLIYGRMPQSVNECIIDSAMNGEEKLGQTVYLAEDNEEDDLDNFKFRKYKVVGIAQSSNYMNFERGNTSIGNGKVAEFMYVPKAAFDIDFYTEILVKFDDDFTIYSDAYDAYMDKKEPVWEELAEQAAANRYERLMDEANEKLTDAKEELAEGKAEGEQELEDARIELADAYVELTDGEKELADGKQELADGWAQLKDSWETVDDAEYEIGKNRRKLEEAEEEIKEGWEKLHEEASKLGDGWDQLNAGQAQLDQQTAALPFKSGAELEQFEQELVQLKNESMNYDPSSQDPDVQMQNGLFLQKLMTLLGKLQPSSQGTPSGGAGQNQPQALPSIEEVKQYFSNAEAAIEQLKPGLQVIDAAQAEIDSNRALLEAGEKQIQSAEAELEEAEAEIADGKEQIEEGIKELQKAWTELSEAEAELHKGEAELADAEKELAEGWIEYNDGLKEYEEGLQEFNEELADAEKKLADAESELADIEEPDSYLLGREANVGYVCLENDSAIVDGIANVFPVFFYAVAALVCITTMSRMIEEQRTQIGVLKALGYSEASIMGKYLFYSGSAAISGCLFGYFFGIWFFPIVIWYAYSSMYTIGDIAYVFDAGSLIFSLVVSVACSMGVTFISCKNELSEVAAELMRPKAPKAGKRIFMEYIPFLWRNMKFLHKVSYRNVFRYKKRFFMMVIGISGCTGLLVTGFGIQDSIAEIANDQYDRIQVFDVNVMMSEEISDDTAKLVEKIAGGRMTDYIFTMEKTIDLVTDDAVKSISLVAIDDQTDISKFVVLPDEQTGELLKYPGDGECILTNKMAKTYDLELGDTVTFRDENNREMQLVLSGIAENYLYNFVYMTTQTYEKYLDEPAEIKSVYVNLAEGVDPHQTTADFMKNEEVASASVSSDAKNRFTDMIESLDLLVVVIIICAGCLAFIVLYNLTNINITERIREIATIKVLGFYKNETSSYVFRENMILTAIGAVAGMGLGYLFHAFVMYQVQVDQVSFDVKILPMSYVYSVLLTFVFAIIVNLFMGAKLDKISMTESLKSVD